MKSVVLLFLFNLILVNSSNEYIKQKKSEKLRQLQTNGDSLSDSLSDSLFISDFLSDSFTPDTIKEADKPNSTEYIIEDDLILGFDNFKQNSDSINFFAYKYFQDEPKGNFNIKLNLVRNLRLLQETKMAECILKEELSKNHISVYNCSLTKITGDFNRIECDSSQDIMLHELAEYMCLNLQNQTGEKFSSEGIIILTDCEITDQDKKITIRGKSDEEIENGANSNLYVISEDEKIIEIPTQFTKKDSIYDINLNHKNSLKAHLDGTLGRINGGKNYYLSFKNDDNAMLDFKENQNNNFIQRSSNGLSAGAIVAIILPLIIVLLAVGGVVLLLRKKPSIPNAHMENINAGNNTIGISSSSSNVVNK